MNYTLLSLSAFFLAGLLDWLIGDPCWLPHPVRLLGRIINILEKAARSLFSSRLGLRFAGIVIVLIAAGGSGFLVYLLLTSAYRLHPATGFITEFYLYFTVLAGGDLRNHIFRVKKAFKEGKLDEARAATAMLVSRDTKTLREEGLVRATLESLFENSADGLVAPLLFIALGGPAAAVFYKAVNTLDSMIGYKNSDYIDLGCFSARLDDLLNYLPARLTAVLIILAGLSRGNFSSAVKVLRNDRRRHDSPNSAWPEAAAAGVLGIKFGGPDYYRGKFVERPVINREGNEADFSDISLGLRLYYRTSLLAFIGFFILAWWVRTWEVLIF